MWRFCYILLFVAAVMRCEAAMTWADARVLGGPGDTLWLDDAAVGLDSLRFSGIDVCVAMDKAASGRGTVAWWQVEWCGGSARVDFDFTGFVDGLDVPSAVVTVCGHRFTVNSGVDCNGGANTLGLEWSGGELRVFAGSRRVVGIGAVPAPAPRGPVAVTASAPARVLAAGMEAEPEPQLLTEWTPEAVDAYFAAAPRPAPQGVWEYLDRITEPAMAVCGGRYRLAVVPSAVAADGYDIIYLGGAVTNASRWTPGMRKGSLRSVGFTGHYLLEWTDAMLEPMGTECYAEMPSDDLLALNFPLWNASVRFRRVTR